MAPKSKTAVRKTVGKNSPGRKVLGDAASGQPAMPAGRGTTKVAGCRLQKDAAERILDAVRRLRDAKSVKEVKLSSAEISRILDEVC